MQIASLALATELALAETRGTVIDRGGYVRVETSDEPGWIDGNFLALPAPPAPDELEAWATTFARELGAHRAVSLRWDAPTDATYEGYTISIYELMLAESVVAPPHAVPIRELAGDELLATADLAWAIGDRHDEVYRQVLARRARWQQRLVADRGARFFGAFEHEHGPLIASLGLVPVGAIGRYQDVQTAASHRRRGLAGALLAHAARAFPSLARFAILAEPGTAAQRVYERVGFHTIERTARAWRLPRPST